MDTPTPLHRLFGLSWIDFFEGTSITVETELDLSLKQQFLDLVLIRKGADPIPRVLPDGFDDLSGHNLITFKSHHEALDPWALWELVGHFVNYRKQASPSLTDLLPELEFRLLAVCARFPEQLARQVPMTRLTDGVFEVQGLALRIRIIVVSQLPQRENNAILHLFSATKDLLGYGQEHDRPYSAQTSTLLYTLFSLYSEEPDMPDKLKEFVKETIDQMLKELPAEKRVQGLTIDQLVKALTPEALEELRHKLKANGTSPKPS